MDFFDYVFCNCQASYLKTNKQDSEVTDIPASFTMFNFDQQPEQAMNNCTCRSLGSK